LRVNLLLTRAIVVSMTAFLIGLQGAGACALRSSRTPLCRGMGQCQHVVTQPSPSSATGLTALSSHF
jgi:hypothetical protein